MSIILIETIICGALSTLNEIKVGFLTLLAIASLALVSIKLTQNSSGFGSFNEYKTVMDDASGIQPKTTIKVAGINAGRIKAIKLQGNKALVIFEIKDEIPVTTSAKMTVKSVGFLGDKFLDFFPGDPNGERLPAGSTVESSGSAGLEDLASNAGEIMNEVRGIVKSIKESLEDEDRKNILKQIVQNIKKVTEDAKKITASIKDVTYGDNSSLKRIIKNIEQTSEQLAFETDSTEQGSFMNKLQRVDPILKSANKAMDDLKVMIADVKAGKGTIGRLMRDEEVVDQVSETLSSVNRLVNRINNLEADIALFTGLNSDNGNHTQFDVDIFPAPERFFRLGFAQNDFGPDDATETEVTNTLGSTTTFQTTRVVEKNKLKFNLQIGRVIQRFGIRAGLIESTGGLGLDYHFPDYGSRLTMEVFDYQEDIGPNVRLTMEVRMWNVFYMRLSGEDLVSKNNAQTATLSAGLRFTDEDLSSFIGLLAN